MSDLAASHVELLDLVRELRATRRAIFLGRDTRGVDLFAGVRDSLTIIGPQGSGKTSSVITPSVAAHPGPVVVTSARGHERDPDVRSATLAARRTVAEEFGGEVLELGITEDYGFLSPAVWWDITNGCDDWTTAVRRAERLAEVGIASNMENARFWRGEMSRFLAPLLHAAYYIDSEKSPRYLPEILGNGRANPESDEPLTAKWVLNELRWLNEQHDDFFRYPIRDLEGALRPKAEPHELENLFLVTENALKTLREPRDWEMGTFDPDTFVRGWGTLYITANQFRAADSAAVIAALFAELEDAWARVPQDERAPSMLWALDEVAVVAPLQTLPRGLGVYGGSGIQLLLAFQSRSQAVGQDSPWGSSGETLIHGTTNLMLFPGLADPELARRYATLANPEVQHHLEVNAEPRLIATGRHANSERLIAERTRFEEQLGRSGGIGRGLAAKQVLLELLSARMADAVKGRYGAGVAGLEEELMKHTRAEWKSQRRTSIEEADIFSGAKGTFLHSGGELKFVRSIKYFEDQAWRTRVGA